MTYSVVDRRGTRRPTCSHRPSLLRTLALLAVTTRPTLGAVLCAPCGVGLRGTPSPRRKMAGRMHTLRTGVCLAVSCLAALAAGTAAAGPRGGAGAAVLVILDNDSMRTSHGQFLSSLECALVVSGCFVLGIGIIPSVGVPSCGCSWCG